MSDDAPTRDQWRRLYDVAARFKEAAPWTWMFEDESFVIEEPETGQFGMVSVMGHGGEHLGVSVYLGAEGIYGFWALQEAASDDPDEVLPEMVLEIPQLQASWEDREMLMDEDRKQMKAAGVKVRGRRAWPMFRAHQPGFLPWHVSADEARFLATALEQALDVVLRYRDNDDLLDPPGGDEDERLLFRLRDEAGAWRDEWRAVPAPSAKPIQLGYNPDDLETLRQRRVGKGRVEADVIWMPQAVTEERGGRPFFPYLLMVADSRTGAIIGFEMLQPLPTLDDMWSKIPGMLLHLIAQLPQKPQTLVVASDRLAIYAKPLMDQAQIKLGLADALPALDAAQEAMGGFMGFGGGFFDE